MKFKPVDPNVFAAGDLPEMKVTLKLRPQEIQEGWRYKHRTRDILVRVKKYNLFSGKQFVSFEVLHYDDPDKDISELSTILSYSEFAVLFESARRKIWLNPDELYAGIIPWKDIGLYLTHLPPFYRAIIHEEGGGPWTLGYTDAHGFFVKFSAMGTGYGISDIQNFPLDEYDIEFDTRAEWIDNDLEIDKNGNFVSHHNGLDVVNGRIRRMLDEEQQEKVLNPPKLEPEFGSALYSTIELGDEAKEQLFLDTVIEVPKKALEDAGCDDVKFKATKLGDRTWQFQFRFTVPDDFWDKVRSGEI